MEATLTGEAGAVGRRGEMAAMGVATRSNIGLLEGLTTVILCVKPSILFSERSAAQPVSAKS